MAIMFDAKTFLEDKSFPAIQAGEHQVVLGKVQVGASEGDGVYIVLPITLNNGRKVDVRFYGVGIQICYNQLRQQTADREVYDSNLAFFHALEGKTVKCYISKRSYTDKNGEDKNTLQYDFVNRVKSVVTEEVTEDDLVV